MGICTLSYPKREQKTQGQESSYHHFFLLIFTCPLFFLLPQPSLLTESDGLKKRGSPKHHLSPEVYPDVLDEYGLKTWAYLP